MYENTVQILAAMARFRVSAEEPERFPHLAQHVLRKRLATLPHEIGFDHVKIVFRVRGKKITPHLRPVLVHHIQLGFQPIEHGLAIHQPAQAPGVKTLGDLLPYLRFVEVTLLHQAQCLAELFNDTLGSDAPVSPPSWRLSMSIWLRRNPAMLQGKCMASPAATR